MFKPPGSTQNMKPSPSLSSHRRNHIDASPPAPPPFPKDILDPHPPKEKVIFLWTDTILRIQTPSPFFVGPGGNEQIVLWQYAPLFFLFVVFLKKWSKYKALGNRRKYLNVFEKSYVFYPFTPLLKQTSALPCKSARHLLFHNHLVVLTVN